MAVDFFIRADATRSVRQHGAHQVVWQAMWEKVKAEADKPVTHDPETDLYNPNDEKAVTEFWKAEKVSRPGRPRVAVKRPTLNMRVDADVMEHLRESGKGWQTRVNAVLREAVEKGRL